MKSMVKVLVLITIALLLTACPGIGPTDPTDGSLVIPESWWGPYERMDSGLVWYIATNAVTRGTSDVIKATSASESTISLSGLSLDRVADGGGLIKVTDGGSTYYLYPKERRQASFSGSVAGSSAVRSALSSRSLSGLGGIKTIVSNLKNPADSKEVITDVDGNFTVSDAIPGDTYSVVPMVDNTEADAVDVLPLDNGSNVGTVSVVDSLYNFKATAAYPVDIPFLFADGTTTYDLTITVTNSGSQTSASPIYTVSGGSSGLVLSGTLTNNLQSIESANSRSFTINVKADPIATDYEDKRINVQLDVYEGPSWSDSVTIRFWKDDRLTVFFESQYGARACILTPEGRMVGFSGGSMTIPRQAAGIKIALSGASTASEGKYTLSLGESKAYSWATLVNPGIHEPNDLPAQATPLFILDPSTTAVYGYLRPNEMDFFEVMSRSLDAPSNLDWVEVDATHVNLSWDTVPDAEKYYVWLNDTLLTTNGISGISLNNQLVEGYGHAFYVAAWNSQYGYSLKTALPIITLVNVPAGSFNNGTSNVTLSAFKMATTEVTQIQFQTVMDNNPSDTIRGIGASNPVNKVNWYQALVFCNKLSILEDRTPVYSIGGSTDTVVWGTVPTNSNSTWNAATFNITANGYRLPTEAEWEYAARGGAPVDNYSNAGSDDVVEVAWYAYNSNSITNPVASKSANKLGLYDMSGNVREFCWDWYAGYASSDETDPTGPTTTQDFRVSRGGGWNDTSCRVYERYYYTYPFSLSFNQGFRLVTRP